MKALLVNPYIYDVSAYDFWLKPVGLLYIASALREAGIDVELLDLLDRNLPGNNEHEGPYGTGKFHSEIIKSLMNEYGIPRYLKRYGAPEEIFDSVKMEPDVILVTSMMTYWYGGVFETIKLLRKRFDAPIILGGNYPTLLPWHAKKAGADEIVVGDGIPSVYESIEKLTGTKIKHAVGKDWFEVLKPDYTFYPVLKTAVVHTTFGCPFRCTYCIAWKKGFRIRSVRSVLEEIEILKSRGVKDIAFYDDALLVKRERFKEILKNLPDDVNYHLPNGIHAKLLDEETAFLLKEKNFKTIRIGYETSDVELQKKTGGKVSNEAFYNAVKLLKKAGFTDKEVGAYLIIGLPGQSFESALMDIKRVIEAGVKPVINEYTLIPGSIDWQIAIKEKLIDGKVDPLLLNNSLMAYWWKGSMGIEKIKLLKSILHKYALGKLSKEELLALKA
ncbi:B12-binding domain-containing radical SAM protein [Mesoaciditoga lauensis]|uniref:B12-binding domain-containing radical SAM protein n=1 Tax=Mesoaciditoga lauensis TaxID=1495039 RepID=UPI000691FCF9|nr:B12-binding domain-containing radical SAM protein [Mesoaciditoga lauensis]